MLNKKIAIITLAAVISNFSFTTTNVLADEITKNVKIVAQTKNNHTKNCQSSNHYRILLTINLICHCRILFPPHIVVNAKCQYNGIVI